jgi:hypothetical protein
MCFIIWELFFLLFWEVFCVFGKCKSFGKYFSIDSSQIGNCPKGGPKNGFCCAHLPKYGQKIWKTYHGVSQKNISQKWLFGTILDENDPKKFPKSAYFWDTPVPSVMNWIKLWLNHKWSLGKNWIRVGKHYYVGNI